MSTLLVNGYECFSASFSIRHKAIVYVIRIILIPIVRSILSILLTGRDNMIQKLPGSLTREPFNARIEKSNLEFEIANAMLLSNRTNQLVVRIRHSFSLQLALRRPSSPCSGF